MFTKKENGFTKVLRREIQLMVHHPIYTIMIVVIPLASYLFFATLMPEGLPEKLPIGVIDHDNSIVSRKMIRQIDATAQSKVAGHYLNFAEAKNDLQKGKIYGFIEIPNNFEKDLMLSNQPKVWFYYTQAFYIPGSLTLKNFSYMLNTLSGGVNLQARELRGQTERESMAQIQPIAPDIHMIGNPHINYSVYLIDIIIPGVLELIILLTTVYAIGVELKHKTSRSWLKLTNYSYIKALTAKLLPYTICFFIMGMLYDVILFKFLHYPMNANILWMFFDTAMLVVSAQAVGVFMIGLLPILRDGLSFASLYGVLAFSFSGFSFPIEGMIPPIQGLSAVFPLRYYFKIYQNFALNGLDFQYAASSFAALFIFLLLPLAVSVRLKKALIYQNFPKK